MLTTRNTLLCRTPPGRGSATAKAPWPVVLAAITVPAGPSQSVTGYLPKLWPRGSATEYVPWPGDLTPMMAPEVSVQRRTPYCWYCRAFAGARGSATENAPFVGPLRPAMVPMLSFQPWTPM